jgi:hypothetical protein
MLTNNFKKSVLSKKLLLIDEFIELRALGHTFDEIVKELGVSKVTLIRWNKKYYEEIDATKKELVRLAAEKIALRNSNMLSQFADMVLSEHRKGEKNPTIDEVLMKRFYKRVFQVYSRQMKGLSVKFNKDGVPDSVVIKWKDEEND